MPTPRIPRWVEGALVVALTLAALAARLLWLDEIPPGLFYDEAYEGLDALAMLRDHTLPVFFPGNFGREPLFIWLLAVSQALFGAEPTVLRATAGVVGALTVPATYLVTRILFGRLAALAASAILPLTLWHLTVTRTALRFTLLPLVECLAIWLLCRGIQRGRRRDFALAGLGFAACGYTYTAARALPLLLLGAVVGLVVVRPPLARARWRAALWLPLVLGLALAPLLSYFLQNPLAFSGRMNQVLAGEPAVSDPRFGPGDPGSLLENPLRTLGMFILAGDQNLRTNLPGRPVFDPVMAACFLLGVGAALGGRRGWAGAFALFWLLVMLLPSALSTYAPHFGRAIGALPPAAALAGLGVATLATIGQRVGRRATVVSGALAVGVVLFSSQGTLRTYFEVWANELGTYTAFDAGIFTLGVAMRPLPPSLPVYVSPVPGDHPTLVYASRRADLRGYDGRAGIVLPSAGPAAYGLLIESDRTSEAALNELFPLVRPAFVVHEPAGQPWAILTLVAGTLQLAPERPLDVRFREAGSLVGVSFPEQFDARVLRVELLWQARGPTSVPLTEFVQLLDASNQVVAQHDSQPLAASYPTSRWQEGEYILERVTLSVPSTLPPGRYRMIVGLYELGTGRRVLADGFDALGDAALAGWVERRPPAGRAAASSEHAVPFG
ncbi:MAG: glycosyltransferase family 39 protein [Chloroflexi bacterium]|nr:glycosyltransferase family 39 protein [Chloroflexota bacterium]